MKNVGGFSAPTKFEGECDAVQELISDGQVEKEKGFV